jgi:hypothetical protein
LAEAASPSSHSSFCEEVFSRVVAAPLCRGVSGHGDPAVAGPWLQHTNEADRSNVLTPGFQSGKLPDAPFSRLHRLLWRQPYRLHNRSFAGGTPATTTIGSWEIVSSYSSATAPALHRISRADPLIKLAKNCSEQYRLALKRSRFI